MEIIKPNLETFMTIIDQGKAENLTELYREFRFYTQPLEWNETKSYDIMVVRYFPDLKLKATGRDHIIYNDILTVNERLKKYHKKEIGPNCMWTSTIEPYLKMYDFKYDELLAQIENLNSPIMPILLKTFT